jgi:hypothetical protein
MPEYECSIKGWNGSINEVQSVSKADAELMNGYVSVTGITYKCGAKN